MYWTLEDGVKVGQHMMYRDIIQYKMNHMLGEAGLLGTFSEETLMDNWTFWFDIMFTDGNRDFFYLAHTSIAFMDERIEDEEAMAM